MASENVFAGVQRNNGVLKKMQSIKLKLQLVESEREYRRRLSIFVDVIKIAAENSECLSRTRIKTILKIVDQVLKGSEGLLEAFAKRGSSHQHADAVYEQFSSHRLRCADCLYTYCAHLQDICTLLQEACALEKGERDDQALHDALLPVKHVEELLDIFQEVKKDLVANRRLVEIFSCNALIEQLTKELERMRKVIKSLNADSLLIELGEMTVNSHRGATMHEEAASPTTELEAILQMPELPAAARTDLGPETQPTKESTQSDPVAETEHLEPSISERRGIVVGGDDRIKITRSSKIPLSRRKSKKLVRYQVQSFASKLSEMKDELFMLQKKLEELRMLTIDSDSESDNECTIQDFSDSNEEITIANDDTESKIGRIDISNSAFSRIRDSETKALLRTSMRRAPLYQKYRRFASDATESSPKAQPSPDDCLLLKDCADNRPESGIVMEDGYHDGSDENMFSDGSKHEACSKDSSDYMNMNGEGLRNKSQNLSDAEYANGHVHPHRYSLQDPNSDYALMIYPTYANMRIAPISQMQPAKCHIAKEDDSSTEQNQVMPADGKFIEEYPTIIRQNITRQRTGWCQIPLVKESGVLEKMTSKQRNLQEAKYEIISSKVSYLKSLSIVQSVFIANEDLRKSMTPSEWNDLFQFVGPIKQCSEHFLSDLLSGWPQDIYLSNQLTVVRQYAESGLQVYVDFCSHKITMDDTLKNIRANNPLANKVLKKLESEEICDGHDLESFLVLPIQRITRFPLLVEGILKRMDINNDKDFCDWAKAYDKLRLMAKKCNEAVQDAETKKFSPKSWRSQSSTLPAKKSSMSAFWSDPENR